MVLITRPTSEVFSPLVRRMVLSLAALAGAMMVALAVSGWTARTLDRVSEGEERFLAAEHAAREAAERTLLEREEAIGAVSHDLRSPLTGIVGFARYLRRRSEDIATMDASVVHGAALEIDEAATRMNWMLEELLDAARLQAGRELVLQRRPDDLVPLLRDVVRDEQRRTADHEIRLEGEPALHGEWDALRLRRVFANLLSNAVKFSPGGGEILVTAAREPGPAGSDHALIAVRDRGIGIPASDLPGLFERFSRAGNAAGIEGTGLGLAGALQVVQLHGGRIEIESREGEGSTFLVRLPLEPAPAPVPPDVRAAPGTH